MSFMIIISTNTNLLHKITNNYFGIKLLHSSKKYNRRCYKKVYPKNNKKK